MITDEYIKENFFSKLGKFYNIRYNKLESTHQPEEVYNYLLNRYEDSTSLKETIFRINYGYDIRPVCENCGAAVKFLGKPSRMWKTYCCNKCRYSKSRTNKFKQTCLEKYGVEYVQQTNEFKNKAKQTCLEKYGIEHFTNREKFRNTCLKKYGVPTNLNFKETIEKCKKSHIENKNIIKEKSKRTCLEKYGVEYYFQANEMRIKSKLTCLEKYGVEYSSQSNIVKQKIKQTCLERYGTTNGGASKQAQEKIKQTCLERYGTTNGGASKQAQEKIQSTKRKNHTFSSSKPEEQLYKDIYDIYPSVIRQYKEERYPYNCDFYIPELDMFIELQGTWTHGPHPFSSTSKDDLYIVEQWKKKEKEHKYYIKAINGWTIKDPEKRNTAKENNLNYVELFSKEDINLFLTKLKEIQENEKSK